MVASNLVTARLWLISHIGLARIFKASVLAAAALLLASQLASAQFTQQGPKLVGSDAVGNTHQGWSVSLSGDGNTAIVGGFADAPDSVCGCTAGAAWVYTRSGGVWTQQGSKLVGTGAVGFRRGKAHVSIGALTRARDRMEAIAPAVAEPSGIRRRWRVHVAGFHAG
jgi:hypothetical protein